MPRPVDNLRAQLSAEDPDFVAALLDGTDTASRLGGHVRGFQYRKGGRVRQVFGPHIISLPDGTPVDTDLAGVAKRLEVVNRGVPG